MKTENIATKTTIAARCEEYRLNSITRGHNHLWLRISKKNFRPIGPIGEELEINDWRQKKKKRKKKEDS